VINNLFFHLVILELYIFINLYFWQLEFGYGHIQISPSSIISTYGNIQRYPTAPFPLFVYARSALITWCFVYKVTNLSSSI